MKPEEIDKLFKNRLGSLPVTPSADAWTRLQAKMEPPKKERTMWLYYAAASVLILMVAGLLIFRNNNPNPVETVAQTNVKKPAEKIPENLAATQATTHEPSASTEETIFSKEKEANKVAGIPPSKVKENAFAAENVKLAETKKNKKVRKERQVIKATAPAEKVLEKEEIIIAHNKNAELLADKNNSITSNPAAPSVVQVLVKMDDAAEQAPNNQDELSLRENISRKGMLLKNIYKQARNLKNGEPVELATLGLDTEKINEEKENIKQKINKVISL